MHSVVRHRDEWHPTYQRHTLQMDGRPRDDVDDVDGGRADEVPGPCKRRSDESGGGSRVSVLDDHSRVPISDTRSDFPVWMRG